VTISFADQVAIITGAGRGLGRQYALDIAARGGAIVVADIGRDQTSGTAWAETVVAEIEAKGGRAVAATDSVATSEGGRTVVDVAMDTFGRLDGLVHNAGFMRPGYFDELSDDEIRDVVDVHVMGAFHIGRPAWKWMKQGQYGRIVLTSSGAIFGYHASTNYAAAKAALIGLTTALANEGAEYGIQANAILPFAQSAIGKDNPVPGSSMGMLADKLARNQHRWGPDSVSPLVTYLASAECKISGRAYSAVAGRYARIALAAGNGWLASPEQFTAEAVSEHFNEIDCLADTSHPASMVDELQQVLDRL